MESRESVVLPIVPANPDRAKIAALAKQHQERAVKGDTAVDYIVMVLDATDKYVWSTIGSGNLSIEVAGDKRTPARTFGAPARPYGAPKGR